MTGAMYAAVAGLRAHMNALNVIGNNISNVNTNAYKASRYTFLESLYTNMRNGSNGTNTVGGKNPAQIGYGGNIGTIDLDMSTKNYAPTGRDSDVMINGNGFFIVGDKNVEIRDNTDLKNMYLTRLGNLKFDNGGYLVDGQGKCVYGFLATEKRVKVMEAVKDDQGNVTYQPKEPEEWTTEYTGQPVLTAIRLPMMATKECATITMVDETTGQEYQKIISREEYDQLVKDYNAMTAEEKKACPREENPSAYTLKKKGDSIYPALDKDTQELLDCQDGQYVASDRTVSDSIAIDEKSGRITCTTTNGETVVVGYIALAKVDNPDGVSHVDGMYYQALEGAGKVYATSIGGAVGNTPTERVLEDGTKVDVSPLPGEYSGILSAGDTSLVAGGLESSGTDLAYEVSNMILVQRGYQANTRIVTVTDTMLEELVNMKR